MTVSLAPVGERGGLAEDQDVLVVAPVDRHVAQQLQRGVRAADLVEPGEVRRERAALGLGGGPVADPDLVLLRVEVLLAARLDGHVLEELEAGVHAPARRPGRGDRRADLERRRAAVLQVGVQDVGGVDEEVRPHQVVGLVGELAEVLLDLPLRVAPGEVRVGLVEADRPEAAHHRRAGERLGQEEHVGVGTRGPR